MNSETFGMLGKEGLPGKIEADNNCHPVHQTLKEVPQNCVNQNFSDDRLVVQSLQQLSETLDQLNNAVQDLSVTSDGNLPLPCVVLSDMPPLDAALSIEKISKTIFSLLDPEDLLRCRLVSSSWLRMATNEKLLKWDLNVIRIHQNQTHNDFEADGRFGRSKKRRFKDLTDVLDNIGSHPFPCSSFEIRGTGLYLTNFLHFFDRYGTLVKYLKIASPTYEVERIRITKSSLLEFLTKLLTDRMPNLETLKMEFEEKAEFTGAIESQLLSSIRKGCYCAPKQNLNLRRIELYGPIPYEIIEAVCCLAPNAERLAVDDVGFWAVNKHRLHLLKELTFSPNTNEHKMETVINSVNKLDLEKLYVKVCDCKSTPYISALQAKSLKRILELSCHSLELLHLSTFPYLPGQVIPPMPKVKVLQLTSLDATPIWSPPCEYMPERKFFPEGTSIVNTFPNLHTINIVVLRNNIQSLFLNVIRCEEATSVERIRVSSKCSKEVFQKHFPNAVVTHW